MAICGAPDDMDRAARWADAKFGKPVKRRRAADDAEPPFSFLYEGKDSTEMLKTWRSERGARKLDANRTERALLYVDPETGFSASCLAVQYQDFPTIEWSLLLSNGGPKDTPIISDIQAVDILTQGGSKEEFVLHHHVGSPCKPTDYRPMQTALGPRADLRIATSGGRSSNSDLPYFNLQSGAGGVILAIGWPGQWSARFTRDEEAGLRIRAGQELTHFRLHPGEQVRAPLIVLQFWRGDRVQAQNVWRRWMLAHNLPRPGGKALVPQLNACSSHQFGEMINANEENQKLFIDRYLEEGLGIDYWWMDAGWYLNKTGWPNTGTWEVDPKRFPRGLHAITDHAHHKGLRIIVWFEPERVTPGTWLYEKHPEWLLGPEGKQKLLDLGNEDARQWLVDHVDGLINGQGIDLYRHDFNIDPLEIWRANDAPDRQGITEIRYVAGFLSYYDELRRRHPGMLIDNCASGGRRNDVETLRRSVPLLRSDYIFEPTAQQLHTHGLAFWVPFYGTGVNSSDPYTFRSQMCPSMTCTYDVRDRALDYAQLRRLHAQWLGVSRYYLGDYYPLTSYGVEDDLWMAWEFVIPDLQEGMVQAFRRPGSPYTSARFRLKGLENASTYAVSHTDVRKPRQASGRELAEEGLPVTIAKQPGSALITFKRSEKG